MFQNGPCFRTIERYFFNLCFEKIYFCSFMKLDIQIASRLLLATPSCTFLMTILKRWGIWNYLSLLAVFRICIFGTAHRMGCQKVLLHKMCHTYSAMIKLGAVIPYLKKIQQIYESRDTPLVFCCHQHFFIGNQQILVFVISRNTDIGRILIRNF